LNINNIIERCLNKEVEAEKTLYFAYAKMVYGICRRYTKDDHLAKDYMQDSFEKLFLNLHKYDAQKGERFWKLFGNYPKIIERYLI